MTRRNQVAAADTPRPTAATATRVPSSPSNPSAISFSHSAISASGSAASSDNPKATSSRRGSAS
jgi:hypothetical protein